MKYKPSVRAQVITRRTYNRPTEGGYETWQDTVDRVIDHQNWLWNRAAGTTLGIGPELKELRQLMLDRKVMLSGRTLWLGGTDISKQREASQLTIVGLGILQLETPLKLGQSVSVKFWHTKGKLQGSYSTSPSLDQQANGSVGMDGSQAVMHHSLKHSQQSFMY